MPRCYISQQLLSSIMQQCPNKTIHYRDGDIPGFILEHRPTGGATWYFAYTGTKRKTRYLRIGTLNECTVLEARARAYELYKTVRKGDDPQEETHARNNRLSLSDFVTAHYMPHAKLKKRSWEVDLRMLRLHILPTFGAYRLHKIQGIDVVSWQSQLRARKLAPGTCNRILALLRFIFSCAIRWGMLPAGKNPCRGVTPFDDNGARERYLTAEEARQLVAALDSLPNRMSALAIKLLLYTGARKSEILSARWEYVDLERRILTVPLSKSGKVRHIPLSDEATSILQRLSHKRQSPWLFSRPNSKEPLKSLFHTWNTVRTRLGLKDVRLHDLRHSFASFLVNSGCSLYEVQKILGHYDPKVTMRYAHLSQSSLVRAANLVGKCVAGDA